MRDLKKLLFIYNPHSGKALMNANLGNIVNIFSKAGYLTTVYPTSAKGDALRFISELEPDEYEHIVCSGGDGTLNEVVNGYMQLRQEQNIEPAIRLGYIPTGSTNDFAASMGLPRNLGDAGKVAVGSESFCCDIGRFNQEYFIYVAAFGMFTDVSYDTDQGLKNILGHGAYVVEALKRLNNVKSYNISVQYDNKNICGDFILGMICNADSIGGVRGITGKDVHMDDGMFECLFIQDKISPEEIMDFVNGVINGKIQSSQHIYYFKTDMIRVESSESIAWTLDGEYGGMHQKAEIENIPQMLDIKIPEAEADN